jgi:2-dehydropantoate 2-reductase
MTLRVGVLGAGAIGGYIGIRLSAVGVAVVLVGRRELVERRERLCAVTLEGAEVRPSGGLEVADDPAALAGVDVVLVTVKSRDTDGAAALVQRHAPAGATVVSFQNGLRNADVLRRTLGPRVVAGMVTFNVVREDDGARFRQGTRGPLVAGVDETSARQGRPTAADEPAGRHAARMRALCEGFDAAGVPMRLHPAIDDVLAGKLLLNLNNGVCAATGLSIVESLRSRDSRWCLSRCMLEGLFVLRAEGYRPRSVIGLPPAIIARALNLPDAILLRLAKKLVSADPEARSSTLQDLDAGKLTEVDELNGAIVALAQAQRRIVPANATIAEIVHNFEAHARPLPFVPPAELRRRIAARERARPSSG